MKNFTLKLILLIVSSIFVDLNAQSIESDSLENLLTVNDSQDTLRVNLLNETASVLNPSGNIKALNYSTEALELADKLDFKRGKVKSMFLIGRYHLIKSDYPLAIKNFESSMDLYKRLEDKHGISKCLSNIGLIQRYQGNYPEALKLSQESLKIKEELKDSLGIANCLSNISIIHMKLGDSDKALKQLQESLIYFKELGIKKGISECYNIIGIIYMNLGDYPFALEKFQNSLKIKEELGDKLGASSLISNIGSIHYYNKDYHKALEYYQKYFQMAEELGNKRAVTYSLQNIGITYMELKDYSKALDWTYKSMETAKELKMLDVQGDIYQQLAEIYDRSENYKKAYANHVLFKELNDSIFNEKNIKKIADLEFQYETDKEKQALELEQSKKNAIIVEKEKREKFVRNVLIIGVILLIVFILVLMRSFAQKHKANQILAAQKSEIEEKNTKLITLNKEIQDYTKELEEGNIKLNELNATKDKFFTVIAHDLKSPFNALLGFSDLLIKNQDNLSPEKRERYNKLINDSSKKIYNLLENLLAWAHSQSGLIEFSPEKINIKALIHEIIILSAEAVQNKNIVLFDATKDKLFITADKNMLSTILRNLISNAIKFSKNGSEISINAHKTKDLNNNEFIEIAVKDQGLGISTERQDKLFKISENSSTPGTDNESGTGLGLILCKEFVGKHGGKIWVESEVGVGSKFIFTLKTDKKK